MEATSWSLPHDARRAGAAAGRECSAPGGLGSAGWRRAQGGQGARRRAHARAAARCDGHAEADPAGWKGTERCGAVDLALARSTSRGRPGAGTAAQDVVQRGGGQSVCARPKDRQGEPITQVVLGWNPTPLRGCNPKCIACNPYALRLQLYASLCIQAGSAWQLTPPQRQPPPQPPPPRPPLPSERRRQRQRQRQPRRRRRGRRRRRQQQHGAPWHTAWQGRRRRAQRRCRQRGRLPAPATFRRLRSSARG